MGACLAPARGPAAAAELVAVPLAAQLLCAPVVVLLSGRVSLVAVAANLLAAPAVAPATVLGVLATVAHPLDATVARLLAGLAGVPVWWIAQVAPSERRRPGRVTAVAGYGSGVRCCSGGHARRCARRAVAGPASGAAAGTVAVLAVVLVVPAASLRGGRRTAG